MIALRGETSDPDKTLVYPGESTAGGSLRPGPGAAPPPAGLGPGLWEALRSSGYEVLGELGRGGMGGGYLARHISLNRPCALKTFSAGGGGPPAAARLPAG